MPPKKPRKKSKSSPKPNMATELQRKLIHLSSLWIVVLYSLVSWPVMMAVMVPLTAVVVAVDYFRHHSPALRQKVTFFFSHILREHEKGRHLSGASYMMLSAVLCLIIFPKTIFIAAFSILIVADSAAALVGKRWGRRRIGAKSLEGTLAFILSAVMVVCLTGFFSHAAWPFYAAGSMAAGAAGLAELFTARLRLDDNLSIPLVAGLVMMVVEAVLV